MARFVAPLCLLTLLLAPARGLPPTSTPGTPAAAARSGPVTVVHAEGDAGYARAVAALASAAHAAHPA